MENGEKTVGDWFRLRGNNAHGLSQKTGGAIFISFSQWTGFTSSFGSGNGASTYGLGLLLHELLHKGSVGGGFDHNAIDRALNAIGAPFMHGQTEDRAARLGQSCFR
jgi:hypothetical protein